MGMNPTMRGAARSKIVWLNVLIAVMGVIELSSAHLTTLFGPKWSAGIMLAGAMLNIVLRAVTTQSLTEKAEG